MIKLLRLLAAIAIVLFCAGIAGAASGLLTIDVPGLLFPTMPVVVGVASLHLVRGCGRAPEETVGKTQNLIRQTRAPFVWISQATPLFGWYDSADARQQAARRQLTFRRESPGIQDGWRVLR